MAFSWRKINFMATSVIRLLKNLFVNKIPVPEQADSTASSGFHRVCLFEYKLELDVEKNRNVIRAEGWIRFEYVQILEDGYRIKRI